MKILNQISFDTVIQVWLQAEWYIPSFDSYRKIIPESIINSRDTSNQSDNKLRFDTLRSVRSPMIDPLPKDTIWYRATFDKKDILRTYIVPSNDWGAISNRTYDPTIIMKNIELDDGHAKKIKKIKSSLSQKLIDKRLILVARDADSIMTIIEGNHRGIALFIEAEEKKKDDPIVDEVIIGISPNMKSYTFHIEKYFPSGGDAGN